MASPTPLHLEAQIKLLERFCDGFHLDLMDDHFVPDIWIGTKIVEEIARITEAPLWVHLMVDDPIRWIERLENFSNRIIISIHAETLPNDAQKKRDVVDTFLQKFPDVGIALCPETELTEIVSLMDIIQHLVIMSVNPGRSGQDFLETTWNKIKKVRTIQSNHQFSFRLCIDGGVTMRVMPRLIKAGIIDFAVGDEIFGSADIEESIKLLCFLIKKESEH